MTSVSIAFSNIHYIIVGKMQFSPDYQGHSNLKFCLECGYLNFTGIYLVVSLSSVISISSFLSLYLVSLLLSLDKEACMVTETWVGFKAKYGGASCQTHPLQ